MAAKVKLVLSVPTKGHKRGDVIEVDADSAKALLDSRSARPVPKSEKD